VSTDKNSRKADLSNVEKSLNPSKALAKVEFIVPEHERIDEDDEARSTWAGGSRGEAVRAVADYGERLGEGPYHADPSCGGVSKAAKEKGPRGLANEILATLSKRTRIHSAAKFPDLAMVFVADRRYRDRKTLLDSYAETRCGRNLFLMIPELALEPLRMTAAKVIEAFYKYARDADETPRQTATRIGVPIKTLRNMVRSQAQPTKRLTHRLAGFLRRVGYL
jgi:hypothetical protein